MVMQGTRTRGMVMTKLIEGVDFEICGVCGQNDAEGRLRDGTPACPYCQEDEFTSSEREDAIKYAHACGYSD